MKNSISKIALLLLTVFIISNAAFSQTTPQSQNSTEPNSTKNKGFTHQLCGFDKMDSLMGTKDHKLVEKILAQNRILQNYINSSPHHPVHPGACPTPQYYVPVVVWVINDVTDPVWRLRGGDMTYAQIQSQINALNRAFMTTNCTGVQFCLATQYEDATGNFSAWPNILEPGVIRISDNGGGAHVDYTPAGLDVVLTKTGQLHTKILEPANYLNIYVVNDLGGGSGGCDGPLGFCPNPILIGDGYNLDGVVIRADVFGDNTYSGGYDLLPNAPSYPYGTYPSCTLAWPSLDFQYGNICTHEVGHYFDLYHTFTGTWYAPNSLSCVAGSPNYNCADYTLGATDGDFCGDTYPCQSSATYVCGTTPPAADFCQTPTCANLQTDNFMYYSMDPCWATFTTDQITRLRAYIATSRTNLVSVLNNLNTGIVTGGCYPNALTAAFSFSPSPACSGTPVIFNAIPNGPNTAMTYSWTFTGGSPSTYVSSTPTVSVTYASPGTYSVTLLVTDASLNTQTLTQTIEVNPCTLDKNYFHNAQWFYGQYCNLDFITGTPVPGTIAWNNTVPTIFAAEGAYSYADAHGNAMYYTDGIHIWNPNTATPSTPINSSPVFPTAASTLNTYTHSYQPTTSSYGIMGCPDPADPNPSNPSHFYLFCAPALEDGFNPVRYTTIDLSTNTVGTTVNLTSPTTTTAEGLTIVPHCNGTDYWIITINLNNSPIDPHTFYVYLLSKLGLSAPLKFSVNCPEGAQVQIKQSPDLKHLAMTGDALYLFDFDNSTGTINNEQDIYPPAGSYYCHQFVGASFDNTSTYLYGFSNTYNSGNYLFAPYVSSNNTLTQVLVSNPSVLYTVGTNLGNYSYMQLGPDDNIYQSFLSGTEMAATIHANSALPSFIPNALSDQAIISQVNNNLLSIPNLPDGIQPLPITPSITVTYNSCTDVTLDVPCMGGYTYNWDFGDLTTASTGLINSVTHTYAPGSYTVTCTLTVPPNVASIVITQVITILSPSTPIAGPSTVCVPTPNPVFYSVPVFPGATYTWSITNGTIVPVNNTATVQWNPAFTSGTISVQITIGGCTVTLTQTVILDQGPTVTLTTNMNACGGNNGSITANVTGGYSPYVYLWSDGSSQTTATATGLSAGTYTVDVNDVNGCNNTASVTIIGYPSPTASITGSTNVSCNGASTGSATVTASGGTPGYHYIWAPSGGTNATASNLSADTYTVTVTDANGCKATASVIITQPSAALSVTTSFLTNPCAVGQVSVGTTVSGGTPGYMYSWSPGGQTGATATALGAGTFTVTVTDANGCTATSSITIAALLTVTISPVTNVLCNGGATGSATASGGGGTPPYNYLWSNGKTTATITGLTAGTYSVTVTDENGCQGMATVTITQPPVLTVTTTVNSTCGANLTATANPSGGTPAYHYSWSNGSSSNSNATITGLTAGTYTVTLTDANGCTATATAVVSVTNPPLVIFGPSIVNDPCYGESVGSINVAISGGFGAYTFSWAPSGGTNSMASNLSAGTYTITVRDANGCTTTAAETVTQPATAVSAATVVNLNVTGCFTSNNGKATASGSGGTSPYAYSWAPNGGTNAIASNLSEGTYTVTVTDHNGCTATATAIITGPPLLTTNVTSTNICHGINPPTITGNAAAGAGGGTTPYTYSWSTGATTSTISGLTSTSPYTVTVTDHNGCTATGSITFHINNLSAVASQLKLTCGSGSTGEASSLVSGGGSPYTYSWTTSPIQTNSTATGLSAGTYILTVTDRYGCDVTASATITTDNLAVSEGTTPYCLGYYYGTATASVTPGIASYTYTWSNGSTAITTSTSNTISGLGIGIYSVSVTDANGCTATATGSVAGIHCHSPQKPNGDKQDTSLMYKAVNVYPNPASSMVTVETELNPGQIENICIYNSLGQRIRCNELRDNITTISISDLPTGLYYYRILDTSGNLIQDDKLMIAR